MIAVRDFSGAPAVPERNHRLIAAAIAVVYWPQWNGAVAENLGLARGGPADTRQLAASDGGASLTGRRKSAPKFAVSSGSAAASTRSLPARRGRRRVRQLTQGSPSVARTGGPDSGVGSVVS